MAGYCRHALIDSMNLVVSEGWIPAFAGMTDGAWSSDLRITERRSAGSGLD